jgi:hypothetical protein
MADFDHLSNTESAIGAAVHQHLCALRDVGGNDTNEWNVPARIQAAKAFVDIVVPVRSGTYEVNDALLALAGELANALEDDVKSGSHWNYKGAVELRKIVPRFIKVLRQWEAKARAWRD